MNQLYTIAEAAKILKVCEWTVRKLVLHNELRHVKIGRVYRFTEKHLDEFVKSKEN